LWRAVRRGAALTQGRAQDKPDDISPLGYLLRCGDDDVFTDRQVAEGTPDVYGGPALVRRGGQYNQQVNVAVRASLTPSMGTKQNDPQRRKSTDDPLHNHGQMIMCYW
jgi:hypothetical protein